MALVITVNISDEQEACLLDSILDIDAWVQAAVIGKVNQSKKRMIVREQPAVMADPSIETIPATEAGLIAVIQARGEYMNRAQRDAAS